MSDHSNPLKSLLDLAQVEGSKVIADGFTVERDGVMSKVSGYLLIKNGYAHRVTVELIPRMNPGSLPKAWPNGMGLVTMVDIKTGERRRLNITVNDNGERIFTVAKPSRIPPWSRRGWED